MYNMDLAAGSRCNMGKFKRDEPTTNEYDSLGELLQLQKLGAGRRRSKTVNGDRRRFGTGGDYKVLGFQYFAIYFDGFFINKGRSAVNRSDTFLLHALFPVFGYRLGKRLFELH